MEINDVCYEMIVRKLKKLGYNYQKPMVPNAKNEVYRLELHRYFWISVVVNRIDRIVLVSSNISDKSKFLFTDFPSPIRFVLFIEKLTEALKIAYLPNEAD